MKTPTDKKDILILTHLRLNSRKGLTEMSRQTKVPLSTIYDRIIRFKNCGLVKRYTALLDFEKLGLNSRAVVLFKVKRNERQKLGAALSQNHNVNCLYKVNNGWDFIAELVFSGMKELEAFLEELEGKFTIKQKIALYIIDEIKKESFLSKKAPHLSWNS